MSNSMEREYTGRIVANEALMYTSANHSLEIFVEGVNDKTCLSRFINKENVKINVANKKCHAIDALRFYLESKKICRKHAISIVDADHDHLLKINHGLKELFLTDDPDLLSQSINSNISLLAILDHDRYHLKEDIGTFRQSIFKKCETIGYLRLVSSEENMNICFNKKTRELLTLSDQDLIKEIIVLNPTLAIKEHTLAVKLKNKKAKPLDLNKFCQGHDLCLSLALFLEKSKKNKLGGKKIEQLLMLSYDFRCFIKTSLYSRLEKWGKENSVQIFEI